MNETLIKQYKAFLDNGKTERECVEQLVAQAKKDGFKDLTACKKLKAGDKVYITKMNKAIALFVIGTEALEKGMNILGAHIDSPRLESIIRRHKFNPEGFRVATPEEAKRFFETLKSNGFEWNCDTEMPERLPKEPGQTADEAAEEYSEHNTCYANDSHLQKQTTKLAFLEGVKWAFEQGVICEGKVFSSTFTSYVKTPGIEEMLNKEFPQDTDVIVQVRRK